MAYFAPFDSASLGFRPRGTIPMALRAAVGASPPANRLWYRSCDSGADRGWQRNCSHARQLLCVGIGTARNFGKPSAVLQLQAARVARRPPTWTSRGRLTLRGSWSLPRRNCWLSDSTSACSMLSWSTWYLVTPAAHLAGNCRCDRKQNIDKGFLLVINRHWLLP